MRRRSLQLVFLLLAAGCGSPPREPAPLEPQLLLDQAMRQFRAGKFSAARKAYQQLSFELAANDPMGAVARYYLAECDFALNDLPEAARGFRRLADDYPDHALAPDALLRGGDALFAQWRRAELDPTPGEEALAEYRELVARYPESRAAERSRLKLAALADRFAEKTLRTGIFYHRLGAYDSAIIYFRSVVADYGESRFVTDALLRLVDAYRRIGYGEEEREACGYLRQYHPGTEGLNGACPATPGASSP
jgi:outer membrane protein assembly factor BamD